jgi:anti-sigma B factor antagonist
MTITERSSDLITVLDLDGKLVTGPGVQLLKDKINSLVLQNRSEIVLNLANVPFIDSSGLGELVTCFTTVTRGGGHLKLLRINERNRDLLVLTKLITVFDAFETEPEAVRSFAAVGAR